MCAEAHAWVSDVSQSATVGDSFSTNPPDYRLSSGATAVRLPSAMVVSLVSYVTFHRYFVTVISSNLRRRFSSHRSFCFRFHRWQRRRRILWVRLTQVCVASADYISTPFRQGARGVYESACRRKVPPAHSMRFPFLLVSRPCRQWWACLRWEQVSSALPLWAWALWRASLRWA